jgi:ABC-2 type transport system ATP-binding protein
VLFSTHILSDVEAICDRIGIIADGRLTDCGTLTSLLKPGVRAVEVLAQGVPPDLKTRLATDGARILERDDGTVLTFANQASADAAVREIVTAGGRLVSLLPHRDTLEALFVQRARGTAQP